MAIDSIAQMRASFAAQFADEDGRPVFRDKASGPAIPVSAAERDTFIAGYDRFLSGWRWRMYLWLVPCILIAGVVAVVLDQLDGPLGYAIIAAGIVPGLIVSLRSANRARGVPRRMLADRAAIAPALARDVARRKALRAMPWPTLALLPVYAGFMVWRYDVWQSPLAANHLFWTLVAGAMILLSAAQAIRKWRVERAAT